MGKCLNLALEARQEGDYKEFSELTNENVKKLLVNAKSFVNEIKTHLKADG